MPCSENSEIHVAACSDQNYAPFVTVMMLSALRELRDGFHLNFHFISNDVPDNVIEDMEAAVTAEGGRFRAYKADKSQFENLPSFRYGAAVYQRILLAEYLPEEIRRVIYIDADTLVTADLAMLWETDLEGKPVAAVEDLSHSACKTIGIDRTEYFNSGVLVMDLDIWRKENIHRQVAEYAGENAQRLSYVDQCSLNAILHKRWKRLPPRWNQQANVYKMLRKYSAGGGYTRTELREAIAFPAIVHFTGRKKPWLHYCFHPSKETYRSLLEETPWAGQYPSEPSLREKLDYLLSIRQHYKRLSRTSKIIFYKKLARSLTR